MPRYVVIKQVSAQYELEVEAETPEAAAQSCFVPMHGEKDEKAMELNSYDVDCVQVFSKEQDLDVEAEPLYEE